MITPEDQVPVFAYQDIEVHAIDPSKALHNKSTGKLKWRLTLQPHEHQEQLFKYEVKYPKDQFLALE